MTYIFIHGLGQDSSSWDKTRSLLPADTIALDLWTMLGDKDMNYANLYQSFVSYCDDISEPVHLCGLSLGGMLALNYAADYPDKLASMAVIGAQYKIPKGLMKFQNFVFRLMPNTSFAKLGMRKTDLLKLTASMLDLDFSAKLKEISCPTLIICGEKDKTNKKASEDLSDRIANAEMKTIKDAGHELNIEAPVPLADMLKSFWNL